MGRGWGAAGFRVEDFNVFWVLGYVGVLSFLLLWLVGSGLTAVRDSGCG